MPAPWLAPAPTPAANAGGGNAGAPIPHGKRLPSHSGVVKSVGITAAAVAIVAALGAGLWYYKRNVNPLNRSQDIDMEGNPRTESFRMESSKVSTAVPNSALDTELPLNCSQDIDMKGNPRNESFQMDSSHVSAATQNSALDTKLPLNGSQDIGNPTVESFKMDNTELGEGESEEVKLDEDEEEEDGQKASEDSDQASGSKSKKRRHLKKVKTKVAAITNLQHRNLVKLRFSQKDKEFLVYDEDRPDLSLGNVLFDPIKRASLDWGKRFNIICGIAKGLLYLHHDSRMRIVHRNLKPSNILLEEDMNPQISDFGMAKMLELDHTRASIDKHAATSGTPEYMAPEYKRNGQYSFKSDIYSFGIIVLEIVTGQRNHDRPLPEESMLHRIWRLRSENKKLEIIDSELKDYSIEEVGKCIDIGLLCIQEDAEKRPTMTLIEAVLIGIGKSTDLPHLTTKVDCDCAFV